MRPEPASARYSAIDLDGMAALVRQMRAAAELLQDMGGSLAREFAALDLDTSAARELVTLGIWAEEQVPSLRRRLSLAQAMQVSVASSLPVVRIAEPVLSVESARAQGRVLARMLQSGLDGEPSMEQVHDALVALEAAGADPAVAAGFFAELGPDTLLLPLLLDAAGSDTMTHDLRALSTTLGLALHDPAPPPGLKALRDAMLRPVGENDKPAAWSRLALLQHGWFPTDFLVDAVRKSGFDGFLQDGYVGDHRGGGQVGSIGGLSVDNVALMFGALANNPEATRLALADVDLNPLTAEVYHLPFVLGTGDDIAAAFGSAMEAATGSRDEPMGDHRRDATAFAFRFLRASGRVRDVPAAVHGSLGRIAASWAPELVVGSYFSDAAFRESSLTRPPNFDSIPGLYPRLFLAPEDVYRFIHGFAATYQASLPFDDAVGDLYHSALVSAARECAAHPNTSIWAKTERAFGNLAGFAFAAKQDVRADLDAADAALRQRIGSILKLGVSSVPSPQSAWLRIGWKVAGFTSRRAITRWSEGSPEQTRVALLEKADRQASFLSDYQKLKALVEVHYPGTESIPKALIDDHGVLKSPEVVAHSTELLRDLGAWSDATDHGNSADLDNLVDSENFKGGHNDAIDQIHNADDLWD